MLSGNGAVHIDTGILALRGERALAAQRFERLVEAVRAHERRTSTLPTGRRPHDVALHRSLSRLVEGR
jgi:hypothetical protein